jgi:uncharacterized protein YcbK (DUF882 family)
MDPVTHVTENFTWSEVACHDGTLIPAGLKPNARAVAGVLERIRARYGGPLIIISWYRTPAYNLRIGGAKHSRHLLGDGVDCRPISPRNVGRLSDLIEAMMAEGALPELGGLGTYPAWVHVDCRPKLENGHVARWMGGGIGSEVA